MWNSTIKMKTMEDSLILLVIIVRDTESLFHMRDLFKRNEEYCYYRCSYYWFHSFFEIITLLGYCNVVIKIYENSSLIKVIFFEQLVSQYLHQYIIFEYENNNDQGLPEFRLQLPNRYLLLHSQQWQQTVL